MNDTTRAKAGGARVGLQRSGRFLSGMVLPNMGAFIAWGFITLLFIPTGWLPNESFAKLVGPMITYLLPLLIAYTGGTMIYETRGGRRPWRSGCQRAGRQKPAAAARGNPIARGRWKLAALGPLSARRTCRR